MDRHIFSLFKVLCVEFIELNELYFLQIQGDETVDTYEAEHIPPLQLDFLAGTGKKGSRHHTSYSSSRSDNNDNNNITCLFLTKVYLHKIQ